MLKKCNKCGFQQSEFLSLGGKKYCKSCNSEINNDSNTIQGSITLSAYEKKVAYDTFFLTMEVLEKYVEKANYYPDWQTRKKIGDNKVTREFGSLEEVESVLSSSLLGFKTVLKNKPKFLYDELKGEYYKWINATRIDVGNIVPQAERLKHWLYEVNEILEGRGERFAEEVAQESRRHVERMNNEEFSRKMNEAFGALNAPLNKERERAQSLEGKSYKDIKSEKRFGGDDEKEKGERAFGQIANTVANKHNNFNYYRKPQQIRNPNYNPLIDDPSEEFLSSEQNDMEGIESSNSKTNYQQKYSKSDLTKVENTEKSNKDKNNKVGTIAAVSIFSALVIGGVILVARNKLKKVKKISS